jgi:hypothetical protein
MKIQNQLTILLDGTFPQKYPKTGLNAENVVVENTEKFHFLCFVITDLISA